MDTIVRDLRVALRSLRRSPGLLLIAALTLALGIGANTAIFSVVNAVLLRPLAYQRPEQLVAIGGVLAGRRGAEVPLSAPEFQDFRRDVPGIEDLAATWPINVNLTGSDRPERVPAAVVSPNWFRLLGVAPTLGRDFTAEDAGGRIGYVALISHELWLRRFGGDRGVIGQTIRLDDDPMTIIGVMPRGFRDPVRSGTAVPQVWAPIDLASRDSNFIDFRNARTFQTVGRLRADATLEGLRGQLDAERAQLTQRYPQDYPRPLGWQPTVAPLAREVVGDARPALLVLLGAVGFVLLIGCANVANLLLARATTRDREIAVRTALGASRRRLIRQLLTESLVLALIGGALGLLLAVWGTQVLARLASLYLPRASEIAVDGPVLVFTACLILVTGIGFGLIPAIQASRPDLQSVLKDSGRSATAGAPRARIRGGLVVFEIAVALILLTGAGLLLRSFQRLVAVEPGFAPERLLTLQVWLPWPNQPETGRYFSQAQRAAFYTRSLDEVGQVRGVREAALVSQLPFRGRATTRFTIEGRPLGPEDPPPDAELRLISANYFAAMEIPLLRGRTLQAVTDTTAPGEVVVNQALASRYWPDASPIGKRLRLFPPQGPLVTVVGVAGDVRQVRPEEPAREELYINYLAFAGQEMSFVVRTTERPERLAADVTAAIHRVDPEQPVFGVMPMTELLANAGAERRFSLLLLTLFAAIALVLSAIGIYGVMAYTTTQRRHEIGIRMALGAGARDVLGLVVGQGMRLVIVGLGLGLVGAWLLSRVLASQLYAVAPSDPVTYASVALLLGGVAFLASYLPAVRATRVDPVISLRSE